jgi:hypothetical protein
MTLVLRNRNRAVVIMKNAISRESISPLEKLSK